MWSLAAATCSKPHQIVHLPSEPNLNLPAGALFLALSPRHITELTAPFWPRLLAQNGMSKQPDADHRRAFRSTRQLSGWCLNIDLPKGKKSASQNTLSTMPPTYLTCSSTLQSTAYHTAKLPVSLRREVGETRLQVLSGILPCCGLPNILP